MAFQLTKETRLKVCGDQVQALISRPRFRDTVWTDKTLHKYLTEAGLDYTLEEVQALNDEMHSRKVVEDVKEDVVEPAAPPIAAPADAPLLFNAEPVTDPPVDVAPI